MILFKLRSARMNKVLVLTPEFNFEEDRTLVEKLFDVDYTCGSTGHKLSCPRVHIHGGSTTSSHQTPLEDKSTIIIRIQSSFFFGCYSVSKHSKVSAMPWHAIPSCQVACRHATP